MTERLADISARIDGIRQLGSVVNAMKGIAAARASAARTQVLAVDGYAAAIASAMAQVLGRGAVATRTWAVPRGGRTGLLLFCAEQGFAGAFSERVLDGAGADLVPETLFLIGTRGVSVATARNLAPYWTASLPSHSAGIPELADRISRAVQTDVAAGMIDNVDVVSTEWVSGRPTIVRRRLFPLDLADLPPVAGDRPLMQIPEEALIESLGGDYFHALVCRAALHAFAAENQARMEAMTAAGSQIARDLGTFEATLRRVRQEAITAEIIELGTGVVPAGRAR